MFWFGVIVIGITSGFWFPVYDKSLNIANILLVFVLGIVWGLFCKYKGYRI